MKAENKNKQAEAKERRMELKTLSNNLVKAAEARMKPYTTVNELVKEYYESQGHKTLKSFSQWKEEGYTVKKGEHALLLWAQPKPSKASKEAAKAEGKEEEEATADFFPVIYLFSQKQVKAIR